MGEFNYGEIIFKSDPQTRLAFAVYAVSASATVASGVTASGGLHSLITVLQDRQNVTITNNDGSLTIYVGFSTTMNASAGWTYALAPGERAVLQIGSGVNPYLFTSSGAPKVTVAQFG